jgi:hypothetical protein
MDEQRLSFLLRGKLTQEAIEVFQQYDEVQHALSCRRIEALESAWNAWVEHNQLATDA